MATLTQLKNKANATLADFWTLLVQKENAFYSKHNRYFQLLITDEVIDGVDTTFIIKKPDYEPHQADIDFEFNSPIPFQIQVDEWQGGEVGFTATATVVTDTGRIFRRQRTSQNIDSDWFELVADNFGVLWRQT